MSSFYFAKLFLSMKLLMRSMSNASGPSSTILRNTCSIFGMISSKSFEQLFKGTVSREGYYLDWFFLIQVSNKKLFILWHNLFKGGGDASFVDFVQTFKESTNQTKPKRSNYEK